MKRSLLLIGVLILGGCATTQPPTEVKIPVAVKCETPDPNSPTLRYAPPYTSVFDAVRDLLGDREAQLAYETELGAALKSCK